MPTKRLAPLSLLLPQALAAGLYSSYLGLSIEMIGLPGFAGTVTSPNQFSHNLMNNLAAVQGTPMVVRVGGNSGDRIIYDKTLTTATAGSCRNADPGAWQCIGPKFFESYGAFPNGTQYSHQFNLGTWNASGFNTLTATVPLACKALEGQLAFYEVGNEPDLFVGSRRPSTYSVSDYVGEWLNMTERFETLLRDSCPDMAENFHYITPSLSSTGAKLHLDQIVSALGDGAAKVGQLSVHNYMGGATSPGVTLQKTLMSHVAVKNAINKHVAYAKAAGDANADYIIGEHNSLFGGGAEGKSDVFGAGLWGVDFTLYASTTNTIKQVFFHQSVGAAYSAWQPTGLLATKPAYYGKLAAGTFLANSDTLDVQELPLTNNTDMDSGYAAYINNELTRLAMINLRLFDPSSNTTSRGSQTYTVNAKAGSVWSAKLLTAAGATVTTGVTFNGFAYEASTNGLAALVPGRDSNVVYKADSNGNLVVTVADSEAVILEKQS